MLKAGADVSLGGVAPWQEREFTRISALPLVVAQSSLYLLGIYRKDPESIGNLDVKPVSQGGFSRWSRCRKAL